MISALTSSAVDRGFERLWAPGPPNDLNWYFLLIYYTHSIKDLLLLLNSVCLVEKQQIPIL
jgi:hypothetical protein